MKTLNKLILIIIMIISIQACKKQSIEPELPIEALKKFKVHVIFEYDSIDTPIPGSYIAMYGNWYISQNNIERDTLSNQSDIINTSSNTQVHILINIGEIKPEDSYLYYIKIHVYVPKYGWKWFIKPHIFHEGDNGIIKFNEL